MVRKALRPTMVIAEPCDVPWEDMTPMDGGARRCERCRKPVHDLSQRSYEQIRAFLREHRGALCAQVTVRDDRLLVNGRCETGELVRGGLTAIE